MLTVGQVQENCFIARPDGGDRAVIIDPGEEAPRLLAALEEWGVQLDAILLTHTHFDHVGAVAPVARATGAPVYCPQLEVPVLQDVMAFVPWPGFGPYESWDPEHTIAGGETLELAGLTFDVIFTPGHSPGHVTYAVRGEPALFSGDVLFENSVGRIDFPGGDGPTLMRSIATLLERFDDDTVVYPGHMGITTLGRERRSNPFLTQLADHR
jgi:hydroxyacylglutathione hydrolase